MSMPSVSAKGFSLDLVLAGSKVGIINHYSAVHSTQPSGPGVKKQGSSLTSIQFTKRKHHGPGNTRSPGDPMYLRDVLRANLNIDSGAYSPPNSLPKLRLNSGGSEGNGCRISSTNGVFHQDNRNIPSGLPLQRKHSSLVSLFEEEGNIRPRGLESSRSNAIHQDQSSEKCRDNATETYLRLRLLQANLSQEGQHQPSLTDSALQEVRHKEPNHISTDKLHSSQNLLNKDDEIEQCHSQLSTSELTNRILSNIRSTLAHDALECNNSCTSDKSVENDHMDLVHPETKTELEYQQSPEASGHVTPSELLSASRLSNSQHTQSEQERAHRIHVKAVSKENSFIKKELSKSLNRLIKRAIRSAGRVSESEVSALQAQLTGTPVPKNRADRNSSAKSGDSGISSESINKDGNFTSPGEKKEATTEKTDVGQRLTLFTEEYSKKRKGKKAGSKHRKHRPKSGRKSRHKNHAESRTFASTRAEKDKTKGVKGHAVTVAPSVELLTLQAFCRPMKVLQSSSKPKPEKPLLNFPQTVKPHTAAIYNNKLPRVPQSTVVSAPCTLQDHPQQITKQTYLEVSQSYPSTKKSVDLTAKRTSQDETIPRKSYDTFKAPVEDVKLMKVFQSERQSGIIQELGIEMPCAPPVTPMPELLTKMEYIPSMHDVRAQRAVWTKLETLERQERKRQEKQLAMKLKNDKVTLKEREREKKRQQRLQVYALNKVMTAWEHHNFREFCAVHGIQCDLKDSPHGGNQTKWKSDIIYEY